MPKRKIAADIYERLTPDEASLVPYGRVLVKYVDRLRDEVPDDDWRKVVAEMLEEVNRIDQEAGE